MTDVTEQLVENAPLNSSTEQAQRTFSTSVLVSAVRCTLTYVVFPFITPLIGLSSVFGAGVGVALSLVAIPANVMSIRRFQRSDHHLKKYVIPLNVGIIILVSILLVLDLRELLT